MSKAAPIELNTIRRPPPISVRFTEEQSESSNPNFDEFPRSTPFEEEAAQLHPAWRRFLWLLLEQPTSSSGAFVIHMFTTFLICLSAFITILETVPAVHSISTHVWFGIESSLVALFTIEYIARCMAWSNTWTSLFYWVFSFYGIIDLLSVFPYYIELMLQQDTSVYFRFSILRMFRLLRVFRPFRYNHTILLTIEVMYLSVRRSQHALLAIGFFVIMILTVFSTLLYFAERGTWDEVLQTFVNVDGDPTQFSSIPAAAWFVIVTITTVGYGEITPRSFLGRLITLPILVCGLLLITLPSFVLGREFAIVWEKLTEDKKLEGNFEPMPPHPSASFQPRTPSRDLTNMKLAQNQTEMSRQIDELAATIENQARMLQKLFELLGGEQENKGLKEKGKAS